MPGKVWNDQIQAAAVVGRMMSSLKGRIGGSGVGGKVAAVVGVSSN